MKARKRPVVVDVVQWTGDNESAVQELAGMNFQALTQWERRYCDPEATAQVFDELHSTWVLVYDDDYIIRGVKGEFYPCRESVFVETYELV